VGARGGGPGVTGGGGRGLPGCGWTRGGLGPWRRAGGRTLFRDEAAKPSARGRGPGSKGSAGGDGLGGVVGWGGDAGGGGPRPRGGKKTAAPDFGGGQEEGTGGTSRIFFTAEPALGFSHGRFSLLQKPPNNRRFSRVTPLWRGCMESRPALSKGSPSGLGVGPGWGKRAFSGRAGCSGFRVNTRGRLGGK